MPRSPPSTRAKVRKGGDKIPVRRSLSASSPSALTSHSTAMSTTVSLADIEATITKCLSKDSFMDKIVELLVTRVKDVDVGALAESLKEATKEIGNLKKELAVLKLEIKKVEDRAIVRADDIEQYTRRNNLRVFGVPEVEGEDTDAEIQKIFAEKLKIDIPLDRLDRTHRVGKKPGPARDGKQLWRPIIVRFSSYRDRRSVYTAKKLLKGTGLVVREDLTGQRAEVLRTAISKYSMASAIPGHLMEGSTGFTMESGGLLFT